MIVALATELREKLGTRDRLEGLQARAQSLSSTLERLREVEAASRVVQVTYALIREQLTPDQLQRITSQLTEAQRLLGRSRENFAREHRQMTELTAIRDKLRTLDRDLGAAWRLAASKRVAPQLELLRLIESLPEIQAHAADLAALQAQLQVAQEHPPRTAEALAHFDWLVANLDRRLQALPGLDASVRAFLGRVRGGTATLADLTDDVLAWCRDGDRLRTFRIAFATN